MPRIARRRASWAHWSSRRSSAMRSSSSGGAAAQGVPAALQPLPRRPVLRHACRQRDPPGTRHAASRAHRPLGDAVPGRARGIRWRRTGRRGHLRRAPREAAGRRPDPLSRRRSLHQVDAGHARRAPGVVLLGAEHGARRRRRTLLFDLDTAIQRLAATRPTTRRPCSLPASITTCCGAGRSSEACCAMRCSRSTGSWASRRV